MIFYLADTWAAQLPSLRYQSRLSSTQPSSGQHSWPAYATELPLAVRLNAAALRRYGAAAAVQAAV